MTKRSAWMLALVCCCAGTALATSPKDEYLSFLDKVKHSKLDDAAKHLFPIDDTEFLETQKKFLSMTTASMLKEGKLRIEVIDSKIQNKWSFLVVHSKVTQGDKLYESTQYEIMALDGTTWKYVFKLKAGDPSLKQHSEEDFVVLEKWWQANRAKYRKRK